MVPAMSRVATLPLFHLYGDPPDDQAFNFVHVETLSSRSHIHNWNIAPHRHRNLFQIFVIENGGGTMHLEADAMPVESPAVIVLSPTVVHGFRWRSDSEGFVLSFTEDVASALGEGGEAALERLYKLSEGTLFSFTRREDVARLGRLYRELHEEIGVGRESFEVAARAYLALICIEAARITASRKRTGTVTLSSGDPTVEELRRLIETNFRSQRHIAFYAGKLSMTPDRLNDHVKRATGVTAGHLLRQRILTEAKRQLVFTQLTIGEIAYDLAFADPSHFGRFFKKQTGITPQAFRETSVKLREEARA